MCSFGEVIQRQSFKIYNINQVLIQMQMVQAFLWGNQGGGVRQI